MKQKVQQTIDNLSTEIIALSHQIHSTPELGLEEVKSAKAICDLLENKGFTVTRGLGSMPTAFKVTKDSGKEGPNLGFMAEYDALPEMGHACGHNIISACAVGAFLGTAEYIDEIGGKVTLIGTPAEESIGGKVTLLREGAFDDLDFALMIHPTSGKGLINRGGRAATSMEISFKGKSAHSSNPAHGINALSAVLKTFANIDLLRPTLHPQDNINGVIPNGGTAPNIIPEFASCKFSLRAETLHRLKELVELVKRSAESASMLVGTTITYKEGNLYAERYPSLPMCEAFKANMESLGEELYYPVPNMLYGSSDVGNVSIKMPIIHDYLSITDQPINSHSVGFAEVAKAPKADEICVKGAKGLAMTAVDVLTSPEFQKEILAYHEQQIPGVYKGE